MTQSARPFRTPIAPMLFAVALALLAAAAPAQEAAPPNPPPPSAPAAERAATDEALTPIMPIGDVRIGMKGYGLTVFQGTKIEPFPVEVVSVINDFSPRRGAIWIRSDHPVLQVSGPVQGMSGSPIFLWEEGEEQTLGEGGKLIGAFAYGFSMVKECLAGVQPIELMRAVATDIKPAAEAREPAGGSTLKALAMMRRLQTIATAGNAQPADRFRLDALTRLAERYVLPGGAAAPADGPVLPPAPSGLDAGGVQRMMLPLSVGSPRLAELTAPLLEPLGLVPVAGGGIAGDPPFGVDAEATRFEPGSVLSIPLAFGDADLSAAGTVTDVLPDGTVLGFGHAMFGQGAIELPMATGYVHFFVPRITISFKQSGSLQLRGSLVQDQNAAVAGVGESRYRLAPADISIAMPGYEESFSYQIANHPQLTPVLAAMLGIQSFTASRQLPLEHTLHLTGEVELSGGRTLRMDSISAGQGAEAPLMELLPALSLLMNNPHENLELTSLRLSARVEPVLRVGTLVNARLEKAEVAPGQTVRLTATVQPYGQPAELLHAELKVPEGLPEGDYPLVLMDASTYTRQVLMSRPHLQSSTSVDDLVDTVQRVMDVRSDAVYLVMQLPQEGIAVGRTELPRLPSSRRAMIVTPTSSIATPFMETAEVAVPTDGVVQGQLGFQLSVRHPNRARLQPTDKKPN